MGVQATIAVTYYKPCCHCKSWRGNRQHAFRAVEKRRVVGLKKFCITSAHVKYHASLVVSGCCIDHWFVGSRKRFNMGVKI